MGFKFKNIITLFIFTLFSMSVSAKKFASQYCEFELPPGWECALEGTEWVCQSLNRARQKEAIIILAAKIRGEQDSLDKYQAYLKKTKTFKLPGGKIQVSEPKYASIKPVNSHQWIDALHLASEVPGFYTRYLATVKADLGVAVTFSVSKDHYSTYQSLFDKVVATLRVFRQKGVASNFKLKKKDEDLLGDTTFIPDTDQKFSITNQKKRRAGSKGGSNTMYLLIGLAVLGGLGFKVMQDKKKKKAKTTKKKKKKVRKSNPDDK
jgi:hypothetical protein